MSLQTLDDMLARLRAVCRQRGGSVAAAIDWLRRAVEPHDLRVTVEMFNDAAPAPAGAGAGGVSGVRLDRQHATLDISAALDALAVGAQNDMIGRVMVCRARRGPLAAGAQLARECNGVVLLPSDGWRVLALPPRAFTDAATLDSDAMLRQYDIYPAEDGTVVTLYAVPPAVARRLDLPAGAWAIATTHGFDAAPLLWCGNQTYARVVHDALARYPDFAAHAGLRLDAGRLVMPGVDAGQCYTIGFRSFAFHPPVASDADQQHVWQILHARTAGAATPQPAYGPGLAHLPGQQRRQALTLREMRDACAASVDGIAAGPCFGFSLRARDGTAAARLAPDVLFESALLVCVRDLVYTRPSPQEEAELQHQSAAAWHAFMAFRALLRDDGGRQRDLYAQIFDARDALDRMRSWLAQIEAEVLALLAPAGAPRAAPKNIAAIAGALAHEFGERHPRSSTASGGGVALIRDFVMSQSHALLYALGWVVEQTP